jgi:ABC-type nitrate/sulfonate/bicarbonate transport system permease component
MFRSTVSGVTSAGNQTLFPRLRTLSVVWWRRFDPLALLGIVLVVVAWHLASRFVAGSILPSPLSVARRIIADFWVARELAYYGLGNTGLFGSLVFTGVNVLVAVSAGSLIGIAIGLLASRSKWLGPLVQPVMMTVGTVPTLVIAPFFLIWFGVGRASSILLVLVYCAVILYVFAQRAADNLDPVFEDYARTLGASPRRVIRDVLIPGTVPQILGGIRIALAGAWGIEAIVELLGAQQGIGKIVSVLAQSIDIEGIFAALIVLGLAAVAFDVLTAMVIQRLAPWSPAAVRHKE